MLCAFSQFSDFTNYIQSFYKEVQNLNQPELTASDVLVFHARIRGEQYEEDVPVSSVIYGLAIQKSKIQVLKDWKTEEELFELFPTIPNEVIDKVWKQQRSWNSCLQILNSLLLSKEMVAIDNCEFLFDEQNWPSLLESVRTPQKDQNSTSTTPSNELNIEDWTLLQMESFISNPECIPVPIPPQKQHHSSSLNDWELIKSNLPPLLPPSHSTKSAPTYSLPASVATTSYRDILVLHNNNNKEGGEYSTKTTPGDGDDDENNNRNYHSNNTPLSSWKPTIIVGPRIAAVRSDRVYMNTRAKELALRADLTEDEIAYLKLVEEEEDGEFCLFFFSLSLSVS
jgi:hypothetical protein